EGKMTLPLIKTLERADAADREALLGLLKATPQERSGQQATAHAIIEKYQGFVLARRQAESLLAEALAGLAIFGETPANAPLAGLAHYVLSRDK
ncbi:MAG: polyprenyl synthetase family protein, partial [Proteobacteria bacterium]|nr:polyprenyl synthetase family protein [Pseudomonadota bacterium]